MHIDEQPAPPEREGGHPYPMSTPDEVPAPVASVAHVSEADDEWNPILPDNKAWSPRGRRATHRATGKH